jgi:transcriptional regulator with XRE-family HTH domain
MDAQPEPNHQAASVNVDEDNLEAALGAIIARRAREYRKHLGLTVSQLAENAGVSKGMLSKIENGLSSPSLATLARLAAALSVPVTAFFRGLEEEREALYVKAGQGLDIVREGTRTGHRYQMLGSSRGQHRRVEPVLVTLLERSEVFPLFQHPGTEFLYMLTGVMEYGYGSRRYTLEPGDALELDGEVAHGPTDLVQLPIQFLSIKAYGQPPDRS